MPGRCTKTQEPGARPDAAPEIRRAILKRNEYKLVERIETATGVFVRKRYSGHEQRHLRFNASYACQSLDYLALRLRDVVRVPRVYACEDAAHEVRMEYLAQLEDARQLDLSSVGLARAFFERCYGSDDDGGFLVDVRQSVVATPRIAELASSGFPMRLGFRGDLLENLRIAGHGLIMADVDSVCLEPLGLSEIVLYAGMLADRNLPGTVASLVRGVATPAAFDELERPQARALIDAGIELMEMWMTGLSPIVSTVKCTLARQGLSWLLRRAARPV